MAEARQKAPDIPAPYSLQLSLIPHNNPWDPHNKDNN